MAFDKLNLSNATTNVLAMSMQDDAHDTLVKVSNAYAALIPLLSMEVGETLPSADFAELKDYIGNGVTMMLEDGDCLALKLTEQGIGYVTGGITGATEEFIQLIDQQGTITSTTLRDVSGRFEWTIDEMMTSLSDQVQASVIVGRLSGLCAYSSVQQADVAAVFSDITEGLIPDLQELRTNILNLGANLSPTSLLTMLQGSYKSLNAAEETNNTIEFAENNFRVRAYCGTVVKELLVSAATLVGQVLIAAGGIVGKIAGVALVGVGYVGNAISTTANAMVATRATYNVNASQYEYAQRLFKGTVNPTYVNEALKAKLSEHHICLVRYPAFNLYIWSNPNTDSYLYEAYANLMLNELPAYHNGAETVNCFRVIRGSDSVSTLQCALDQKPHVGSSELGGYPLIDAVNYFNGQTSAYSQWLETPSDEEMRRRVTLSAAVSYWQMLSVRRYAAGDVADYLSNGFMLATGTESVRPEDSANAILWNFFVMNQIPTWAGIVNILVPAIQQFHDVISDTPRGLALFSGSADPGVVSCDGSVSSCPSFRESYLVTPPDYTPQSIIGAVAITLGAVAAVTASFFVVKGVVKRKVTREAVKRYQLVQDSLKNWQNADPADKEAALRYYLKQVRSYNLFAKLTGTSTINSTDGWLTGDTGGLSATPSTANQVSLNTILRVITGQWY